VPEPSGAPTQWIQIRYHLSGGVLYGQRADQGAPGVPLTDGVEALAFNYYQARGTTRTAVDASPGAANEVQVRLAARRGSAVTAVTVLVNLRNAIVGAF